MKQLWSDLPNAQYIDWVLNSLKENPKLWHEALNAANDAAPAARIAALDAANDKAKDKAWLVARHEAWGVAQDKAMDKARTAAWGALLALIAYDNCDQYLALGFEKLKMYAALSEKPQAVLLLPMAYVLDKLNHAS